jgi:hypothetical protein
VTECDARGGEVGELARGEGSTRERAPSSGWFRAPGVGATAGIFPGVERGVEAAMRRRGRTAGVEGLLVFRVRGKCGCGVWSLWWRGVPVGLDR